MLFKQLILLALFISTETWAASNDLSANLRKIASNAQQNTAISVVDLDSGAVLADLSAHQPLKPASVMKLVTSAAALDYLGPDYRFSTELFYDGRKGGRLETLYIRGGADPSLTLENLWLVVRKLKKLGIDQIDRVVLDDSRFASQRNRVGQRAYEAGSGALSLSFNSVAFDVCPGALNGPVIMSVDPWEAPVQVKGSIKTIAGRGGVCGIDEIQTSGNSLVYAVSGTFGQGRSCETFYRSIRDPILFFGSVFRRFAADLDIKIGAVPTGGVTPSAAKPLANHQSKSLSLILEDMNHFSTNFIAEQVLYALGQGEDGSFDRQRGLQRVGKFLTTLGVSIEEFALFDGSGLSHDNRLTAAAITTVLRKSALNNTYGVEYEKSLSVGGGNGTLKERNFGPQVLVRGKTGTLDGVSALSGILMARSGRRVAFAILQNGKFAKEDASLIEDKMVMEIFRSL